jgi:dihydroxy-acid dehydratase
MRLRPRSVEGRARPPWNDDPFRQSRLPSRYVSSALSGPPAQLLLSDGDDRGGDRAAVRRGRFGGNDSAPCNTTLDFQADICREGVVEAGGTPRRFNTITVTDGIAMGHQGMRSSLVSREVIADSIELSVRGHCYDAIVGFAGCDKSLPGMMMAMLRLNVPSIFVYGGSILPGRYEGRDLTVQDVFEVVGRWSSGNCPLSELTAIEKAACPGHGACGGQFTANTMACVGEAIGLSLPNSNMAPAPYKSREEIARLPGARSWRWSSASCARATSAPALRSRTPPASLPRPAARPTARCTCRRWPTNAGSSSTCSTSPRSSSRRPTSPTSSRAGSTSPRTCTRPAAVYMAMKTLLAGGFLDPEPLTVTGKTLGENIEEITWNPDQKVIYDVKAPITPTGGVVGLRGSLAPEGRS